MNPTGVKARLLYAGAILVGLFVGLSPLAAADTYPYLNLTGGDTWTGGWIGNSCNGSNYQNGNDGGIATYLGSSGSYDDYAAYSLGKVDGAGGSPRHGFKTDATGAGGNNLTFASGGSTDGVFEGSTQQQHCVPDYFGTKQSSPTDLTGATSIDVGTLANQQYIVNLSTGSINISGNLAAGQKTTLFVKGNVHITNNIIEPGYNETNVPKFALVVKGNIFITPNVTQIDGWYIAQPTDDDNNGIIWTCTDTSFSATPQGIDIKNNCNNHLTVNGSLTAKQVNYLRTTGDVNGSGAPQTPAETINYTAANVVGGPFFNLPSTNTLEIQSLVSLPPLF